VKRVAEEQLCDSLARLELSREATKARFIVVGGRAEGELRAKLLGETPLQTNDRLLAYLVFLRQKAVGEAQFVLGEPLHADEETTLPACSTGPLLDGTVYRFPASQIEIANTEIGMGGQVERLSQCR
jgi:hypothetical protein